MIANPKGCVGLEDIAALAEGRLSGAERERVVEHVAGCEECREVLAAVLSGGEKVQGPKAGGAARDAGAEPSTLLSRGARKRPWPVLRAVAAGLALVIVLVSYHRLAVPPPPDGNEWLAGVPAEALVPHLWGTVVTRGNEGSNDIQRRSAELGALLLDLEVALAAKDADRASTLLLRVGAIGEQAGLSGTEPLLSRELSEKRGNQLLVSLGSELAPAELRFRERFVPFYLDLGSFCEQARLAALAGDPSFLRRDETRDYVEWLLSKGNAKMPPQVRQGLITLADPASDPTRQAHAASRILEAMTR
jgi:hypothetical protein